MGKKKRPNGDHHAGDTTPPQSPYPITDDASHPIPKKTKKRKDREEKLKSKPSIPTVSIAVPGSIIDNAQSLELATRLAGQIARAATIFRIDEVVVFENSGSSVEESSSPATESSDNNESGAVFLIKILKYLETPQYLRKILFPKQNSLRYVGVLPPLDAPHHLRKHEWAPYRDGITLKERAPNSAGTLVDVGLIKNVVIDQVLEPGQRVTVAMGANRRLDPAVLHQIVSPLTPRDEGGMYWGYRVRHASSLSSVFEECPYEGGYDYLIGTSEHGSTVKSSELLLPTFRHLLIAFGGLAGLEESIEEDKILKGKDAREVFNSYLNVCPNQGSRTIRTEEAIFVSLQYFQEPICGAVEAQKPQQLRKCSQTTN
ncbi:putative methyltransferase C9orf114 [Drosera capensis]